ncbi:hypothetical protein P3T29_004282 [Kitasatospora sp. MAP5-34]|nr:DUF4157 domain-containing protein [Kitasatospora sp. MAP5-34]MDH6578613.1 hypothetical protein [Kitasatospora sp. MAP5-34]
MRGHDPQSQSQPPAQSQAQAQPVGRADARQRGGERRSAQEAAGPGALTPEAVLELQRTVGNAAVARLLQRPQHGHDACCGHQEPPPAAAPVQRSTVHEVLRSPGRPMRDPLRAEMEARLGADFTDVRVHDDPSAARSAAEVGARAYTSGRHVVLGAGGGDRRTMAHELTHVIQQRSGPVSATEAGDGLKVSDPSDRFERAAEANAARVMAAPLQRAGGGRGGAEAAGVRLTLAGGGAPRGSGGPAALIQRDLAVQIKVRSGGGTGVAGAVAAATVTKVVIVGRPPHQFAGSEGAHTTPWAMYGDSVRRRVVGQTIPAAITAMQQLLVDGIQNAPLPAPAPVKKGRAARSSAAATSSSSASTPSADDDRPPVTLPPALAPGLQAHADLLTGQRKADFMAAVHQATAALQNAADSATTPQTSLSCLQEAISAYLTARNLAPFSAANIDPNSHGGNGEPASLEALRAHEAGTPLLSAVEAREFLWGLLDRKTTDFTSGASRADHGDPDEERVPGFRDGQPVPAVASILSRHLHEMAICYPHAYATSQIWDDVLPRVKELNLTEATAGLVVRPGPQAPVAAAPGEWSRTAQPAEPGAYQVRLATSSTPSGLVVAEVSSGGRYPTLFGSDQGHHLTANGSIERAVRRALVGQDIADARARLQALAFPGALLPTDPGTAALPDSQDPRGIYAAAHLRRGTAFGELLGADFSWNAAGLLQEAASAYLQYRSALPMAAVKLGSNANNKAEQVHMYYLDIAENPAAAATLRMPAAVIGPVRAAEDAVRAEAEEEGWSTARTDTELAAARARVLTPIDAAEQRRRMWNLLDKSALGKIYERLTKAELTDMLPGAPAGPLRRLAAALEVHLFTMEQGWPAGFGRAGMRTTDAVEELLASTDVLVTDEDREELRTLLGLTGTPRTAARMRELKAELRARLREYEEEQRATGRGRKRGRRDSDDDFAGSESEGSGPESGSGASGDERGDDERDRSAGSTRRSTRIKKKTRSGKDESGDEDEDG